LKFGLSSQLNWRCVIKHAGTDRSVNNIETTLIGHIDIAPLQAVFGPLKTDEVVVTTERIAHIKEHHAEDYTLFEQYRTATIESPDLILQDANHVGTIFAVKKLPETNLNVVIRLALAEDDPSHKNSVMTFYRIREKNLIKLIAKHPMLYKRE
jgi:hypothetical protein